MGKGNCTKEYSAELVEKYWEREWEKIKQIDFPPTREYEITTRECETELRNLRDGERSWKTASKTIIKMHPSMKYANKKSNFSPYDYWQLLKQDSELFKKFYENRLRCSNWFNEKQGANFKYLAQGFVPDFIYGIGLTTSGKAPMVSYFKPALGKYLIKKYLNKYDTVFDPCSGYSGRLIGAACAGKNYIGQDINKVTVEESNALWDFIKPMFKTSVEVSCKDSLNSTGEYECMLTCTPYEDLEEWFDGENKLTSKLTCDEWIDKLVEKYKCDKYVFVTDDKISKYRDNIAETLTNQCHWGSNKEHIVVVER